MSRLTMLRRLARRDPTEPLAGSTRSKTPYRFGAFCYHPCRATLYRGETEVDLPPRVLDLLEYFLERPEQVIAKNELLAAVWEDKVVGDESLTQAVSILRHALRDDARSPTYVRTVTRRGYLWLQPPAVDNLAPATKRSTVGSSLLAPVLLAVIVLVLSQCRPLEAVQIAEQSGRPSSEVGSESQP